jgi:DMSO/TMAO reductase YedYZ heme-binding membrane subunit
MDRLVTRWNLTTYMVLDQRLDMQAIWADIVKRPYIIVTKAETPFFVILKISSPVWCQVCPSAS